MTFRSRLTFAAASILAVACGASQDGSAASSEDANTEGKPLTVVAAPEWARCWFDVAGADAQLSCSSPARPDDPIGTTVEITAAGMGNPAAMVSAQKTLDRAAGGTVVVGTFPRASFPVMLMLHATATREGAAAIGAERIDLWSKPTIQRPEDLSKTSPTVMKQPFDLWPTAFIEATDGANSFTVSASYEIAHEGLEQFLGEKKTKMAPTFYSRDVAGKLRYFAAPASGGIALTIRAGGSESTATLERPGYYAVGAAGMRLATTEEIARDFPGGAQGPGTGPVSGGATDPPPPPPPVDTDPTCGGNGQSRCSGGTCDDGTRYDSNSVKCVSCGSDGQTFCYSDPSNTSGNKRCNDGTRYDANTVKCVACGNDAQTFCFTDPSNASGNKRCNAGTRYDANTVRCVACGNDGQTFCFTDPTNATGDKRCNDGTRYDASTVKCVACGAIGQTYCLDGPNNTSGNPKCNSGARYDANSRRCVAQ